MGVFFRSIATTEDVLFVCIGIATGESVVISEVHALRITREIGMNKKSGFIGNMINR